MAAPTFVSSSPTAGEVDVDLNQAIRLTFSEALDPATVVGALVQLKHVALDEIVETTLELSDDGTVVTITPAELLFQNASYQVTVVGADTAGALGAVKSLTGDSLATTVLLTFQTGTGILTDPLAKTQDQIDAEGDLVLPENVEVTPDSSFGVSATDPHNHAWAVLLSKDKIEITFNDSVDPDTVDIESVDVDIFPFFEEDQHFAVDGIINADGDICPYFEFQGKTADYDDNPLDFSAPTGALSVTGQKVIWTRDTGTLFPYNACIEVFLDSSLASTGGNELGSDKRFVFYTKPWPDWVSVRRLKHELYPIDLSSMPDDYLGLTIWSSTMEIGNFIRWAISDLKLPSRTVKKLVKCYTVAQVFYALTAEKGLLQGTYKRLGDFEVEVRNPTARSADVKPFKLQQAEECIKKLLKRLTAWWNRPRNFVKGSRSVYARPDFRRRLWRDGSTTYRYNTVQVVEDVPAANTAYEREPGLPGQYDTWS